MKPTFIPPKPRFDQLATGVHAPWTSIPQAEFDLQFSRESTLAQSETATVEVAMRVVGDMRPVVVKRFTGADEGQVHERFAQAAQVLQAVAGGPHVIEFIGAFRTEHERYIVTERMDGTLAQRIAVGALPPQQVAALGQQIGQALAHLQQCGVGHHDVVPENIVLDEDGTIAKLIDFDQATGSTDPAIDIAGLASTLAYALTGEEDARKQRRKLPAMVAEIIQQGLHGSADANAAEWAARLTGAIGLAYKPKPKKSPLYNAGLVAVLGAALFGIYWFTRPAPPPPPALACAPIQYLEESGPPPVVPEPKAMPVINAGRLERAGDTLRKRDELVRRYTKRRRGKRRLAKQIVEQEQEALRLLATALDGLPPSPQAKALLDAVGTQEWRAKALRTVRGAASAALAKGDAKDYHLQMEKLYRLDPGDPEAAFARRHRSQLQISQEVSTQ